MAVEHPESPSRTSAVRVLPTGRLFTINDIALASGLPQPVAAQLVPRIWIDDVGWMYTSEHLQAAIEIGQNIADGNYTPNTDGLTPCVRGIIAARGGARATREE